ncbi:hypothetical protein SEA_SHAGRAT_39 [Rhodococcus phage Shagrat]|nr:hypothetical protein SEA_SHAGRAT_39 [Rhodococcus phage Shagrat]
MSRRLTRRGGHAIRGTRTLCGKPAPASGTTKVTCSTCSLILSASPHLS